MLNHSAEAFKKYHYEYDLCSIPGLATWISEIGYLLILSRYMAEIPLKRSKSSIKPKPKKKKEKWFVNKNLSLALIS